MSLAPRRGWEPFGPNFDFRSVEACRTPDARHCVNLSGPEDGFSKRPPVVGAWFSGWYLFAIDQRFAHDTAFALRAYSSPGSEGESRPIEEQARSRRSRSPAPGRDVAAPRGT